MLLCLFLYFYFPIKPFKPNYSIITLAFLGAKEINYKFYNE